MELAPFRTVPPLALDDLSIREAARDLPLLASLQGPEPGACAEGSGRVS